MDKLIAKPVAAIQVPTLLAEWAAVAAALEAEHGKGLQIRPVSSETVVYTEGDICNCGACLELVDAFLDSWLPLSSQRMILCESCGNKRCPHAWSHEYECTRSNEPGQTPVRIQKESS